jgi:hypothetical protein
MNSCRGSDGCEGINNSCGSRWLGNPVRANRWVSCTRPRLELMRRATRRMSVCCRGERAHADATQGVGCPARLPSRCRLPVSNSQQHCNRDSVTKCPHLEVCNAVCCPASSADCMNLQWHRERDIRTTGWTGRYCRGAGASTRVAAGRVIGDVAQAGCAIDTYLGRELRDDGVRSERATASATSAGRACRIGRPVA